MYFAIFHTGKRTFPHKASIVSKKKLLPVALRDRVRVNRPAPSFVKEEVCIITDESFHEIIFWERHRKTRSSFSQSRDLTTSFPPHHSPPAQEWSKKLVYKTCKATR